MKKRKNKISLVSICVIVLFILTNLQVYANSDSTNYVVPSDNEELDPNLSTSNTNANMVLNLDRLNFYQKPMEINKISDKTYTIKLFDLLFDYGTVKLSIENKFNDIAINRVIERNEDVLVDLDSTEYDCEIRITDENNNTITYIGTITNNFDERTFKIEILDEGNYSNRPLASEVDTNTLNYSDQIVLYGDVYEPGTDNNSFANAVLINEDDNMFGSMYNDRVDYYKVTFNSTGKANFWLGEYLEGKPHNLYVYDKNQTLVGSSTKTTGTQQLVTLDSVKAETYYIKVEIPQTVSIPTSFNYKLRAKLYEKLQWPTTVNTISACFAKCPNYAGLGINKDGYHYGVDIACGLNTIVNAMQYGKVVTSTRYTEPAGGLETYGNYIEIVGKNPLSTGAHDTYLKTRYCHLETRSVSPPSQVLKGATIGKSGGTGYKITYDYHLHIETLYGSSETGNSWTRNNPLGYFTDKTCSHPTTRTNLNDFDQTNYLDNMNIPGIAINDVFIDIDTLTNMSTEELQRYGINNYDLQEMIDKISYNSIIFEEYYQSLLNIQY